MIASISKPETLRCVLHLGDCLEVMRGMADNSVDAVVTDPPYGLSFMGAKWDYDVPRVEVWRECLRVLKPGGHLLSFAGTRTQHRMAVNIEDAGFEIRDVVTYLYDTNTAAQALIESLNPEQLKLLDATFGRDGMLGWVYGSGFPKSMDVSKAIDKAAGADREVIGENPNHRAVSGVGYEGVYQGGNTGAAAMTAPATDAARQWSGWGTALKPAYEPIIVARKPLEGTVAANVLAHGTGGINVDGCRVGYQSEADMKANDVKTPGERPSKDTTEFWGGVRVSSNPAGRWPANLIHDGSDEVVGLFPVTGASKAKPAGVGNGASMFAGAGRVGFTIGDTGSAARFFYCAKASKRDRDEGLEGFEEGIYTLKNDCPEHIKKEEDGVRVHNSHPT